MQCATDCAICNLGVSTKSAVRCTELQSCACSVADRRTDGRTDSNPPNDYAVHNSGAATTKYVNGPGGASPPPPHRPVSLFYFTKTKALFPQITAVIFQHTWKSRAEQHYHTHTLTIIQAAAFSHRTCTSFIQIHLGILTASIFCVGCCCCMLMWGGGGVMGWVAQHSVDGRTYS
jgi:hypothetical protein